MSARSRARGRTQPCGDTEARAKLRRAEQFMEVAKMIMDEAEPDPDWASAAAALAVLAGISASDAACCKRWAFGPAGRIIMTPKLFWSRSIRERRTRCAGSLP